jgi:hypothetical protein
MKRPIILIILADELRADALGCFGNAVIRTPALDRLAAGGTRFSARRVTQPTCTPSRESVDRMLCVGFAETDGWLPDDPRFLPRILAKAGYRTASIGKIHLVPRPLTNLICPGRALSVERDVLGPLRVMAPCMAMGEAAGVAAKQVVDRGCSFAAIGTDSLRAQLRKQGAIVDWPDASGQASHKR